MTFYTGALYECIDKVYTHIRGTNVNLDYQPNGPGPWPDTAPQCLFTMLWQLCSGRGSVSEGKCVSFVIDSLLQNEEYARLTMLNNELFLNSNWCLRDFVHESVELEAVKHEIAGERNRRRLLLFCGDNTNMDEISAISKLQLAKKLISILKRPEVNTSSFLFDMDVLSLDFAEKFVKEIGDAAQAMVYFADKKRGRQEETVRELFECLKAHSLIEKDEFSCETYIKKFFCTLSCDQRLALYLAVENQENMFITGSAGTGKSTVTRLIYEELKQRGRVVAMTATTGKAGSLVSGSTIHSWAGIGLGEGNVTFLLQQILKSGQNVAFNLYLKRWTQTDVLFIDEVSQLKPELLQKLHEIAVTIRKRPGVMFGGMQLIVIGDFFQLAPVYKKKVASNNCYCFQHELWKKYMTYEIELCRVFRQDNEQFVDMLNAMRRGSLQKEHFELLRERLLPQHPELQQDERYASSTRLYARKIDAARQNAESFALLDKSAENTEYDWSVEFGAQVRSEYQRKKLFDIMQNVVPVDSTLKIKVGMRVLCSSNVDQERNIINGSAGIVVGFAKGSEKSRYFQSMEKYKQENCGKFPPFYTKMLAEGKKFPLVQWDSMEHPVPVYPHVWQREDEATRTRMRSRDGNQKMSTEADCEARTQSAYEQAVKLSRQKQNWEVRIEQIPLQPGWATTIHRSQGMTIQNLAIDTANTFASGQTYVACSRACSLDGLFIENFDAARVRADLRVKQYDVELLQKQRYLFRPFDEESERKEKTFDDGCAKKLEQMRALPKFRAMFIELFRVYRR